MCGDRAAWHRWITMAWPPRHDAKHGGAVAGRRTALAALAWRLLDLSAVDGVPVDLVIATRFPSYAVAHPRKIVWLVRQHRQTYDWYGTPLSDFCNTPEDVATRDLVRRIDRTALAVNSTDCCGAPRLVAAGPRRSCAGLRSTRQASHAQWRSGSFMAAPRRPGDSHLPAEHLDELRDHLKLGLVAARQHDRLEVRVDARRWDRCTAPVVARRRSTRRHTSEPMQRIGSSHSVRRTTPPRRVRR
jgi:hypothetical protein